MEYRNLGSSGLKVSVVSYGNWVNSKGGPSDVMNEGVKFCWNKGVNFFDTAEAYSDGVGEEQLGHALRELNVPRNEQVVSTKLFWNKIEPFKLKGNRIGTNRKKVMESMDASLKRLQMDYVDIVFFHRYDHETPIRETQEAIRDVLDSGKALYWGTSMWPPIRLMEAMHICDELKMARPIAEQCQYNMLERNYLESTELGIATLQDEYGLGTTVWSPLGGGLLTGKYNNGIPADSRFATNPGTDFLYNRYLKDEKKKEGTLKAFNAIEKMAKEEFDCSMAVLALAWVLEYKGVSTAIVGSSKTAQLEENFKALEVKKKLTPDHLKRLDEILNNAPAPARDFTRGTPEPKGGFLGEDCPKRRC